MQEEFNQVKKIIEEHLSAINDNTGEIQVLFDYLLDVEKKMDKISQRLDLLQMSGTSEEKIAISPLSSSEKKVFLALYTEESALCFEELSEKSGLDLCVAKENISSLIGKGIPLQRSNVDGVFLFSLEPSFKEIQAKQNVVNLSLESFM